MRKGSRNLVVAALVASLSSSGCGVILGYGALQPVAVTTTPAGAKLFVDGIPHEGDPSPTTVLVHPKTEHYVQAKLDDGSAGQSYVSKHLRIPVVVLDGVLTLGIGLLIDYLSGSLYQVQSPIHINLGKSPPPSAPTPPPTLRPTPTTTSQAPCPICGEPRGDVTPCPHCGME